MANNNLTLLLLGSTVQYPENVIVVL